MSCPSGFVLKGSKCYDTFSSNGKTGANWLTAEQFCESKGGTLLIATAKSDLDYLLTLSASQGGVVSVCIFFLLV